MTRNDLSSIGAFRIVGSSKGCSRVLAQSAEFRSAGAPRRTDAGVTHVVIMPGGRGPAIPRMSNLTPVNELRFAKRCGRAGPIVRAPDPFGPLFPSGNPSVADQNPPVIRIAAGLSDAAVKETFAGSRAIPFTDPSEGFSDAFRYMALVPYAVAR